MVTTYVLMEPGYWALFYDSKEDAIHEFDMRVGDPDHFDNMVLMEFKLPQRAGAPKVKIIGVRSQGYEIGDRPTKKRKK